MPDIAQRLGIDTLVIEGAMGTMLQRSGVKPGVAPELMNVVEPDLIVNIHSQYHMVGADCACSNTFGGSRPKLKEYGLEDQLQALNRIGVELAREGGAPHVLADIGPTGLVLAPAGSATFSEVYDAFKEQASALALGEPDAFLLETFTDIAEARIAVLACKEAAPELPVLVSVTLDAHGRMPLSGTDCATAALILEGVGAAAVGVNCGMGPEMMLPFVERIAATVDIPFFAQPNAGMPTLDHTGKTVYPGTPDEMAAFAIAAHAAGATAVGSCCGSTSRFTGAIAVEIAGSDVVKRPRHENCALVTSTRDTFALGDGTLATIGERINPTGRPALRDDLLAGSVDEAVRTARDEEQAGATLLDVNVGAAGVDARAMLPRVVEALTRSVALPLCLDTTDGDALEAALRIYPGRALVNSVNAEAASYERVLPLVAAYGASVVVLPLDENGIPATPEGRIELVEKVARIAEGLGISRSRLLVDALVMTAAADSAAPSVTLTTLRELHARGFYTVLGVSNVSHGLPLRRALNAAFLTAAGALGLDAAIVNPNDSLMADAARALNAARDDDSLDAPRALAELDAVLKQSLEEAHRAPQDSAGSASDAAGSNDAADPADAAQSADPASELRRAVMTGDAQGAVPLVDALIGSGSATVDEVITGLLTPVIQELGDGFGRGEVFLPQLMVAADAMKAATEQAKTYLEPSAAAAQTKGHIAFATVQGDIHSIGKDICISLLESQGYEVRDLGVDVPIATVAQSAQTADVVILSALMTTTLPAMEASVRAVEESAPGTPVMVGGAVVTADYARSIQALYSDDAPGCVALVDTLAAAGYSLPAVGADTREDDEA